MISVVGRDKKLMGTVQATAAMTGLGAGSLLWMAPEVLSGQRYNEQVDIYSFAMCLIELIDCKLPWHWCGQAEVTTQVTRGQRPERQLESADRAGGALGDLAEIVRECWRQEPQARPTISKIVALLEADE